MDQPPDQYQSVSWQKFFTSWGAELEAQLDRVGHLIGPVHRQSEGSFREILLRGLLRRVLPPRYRVSTGFVVGWGERASTQMDVIVWDAEKHTPLMEVGEFAIVSGEAVRALVEVKTTLSPKELRSALGALHPDHYWYWDKREPAKSPLQAPKWHASPPVRGVLAYRSAWGSKAPRAVLSRLAAFYRSKWGSEIDTWIHTGDIFRCANVIDVVGVGDAFVIEEGTLFAKSGRDAGTSSAGFCARAFSGDTRQAWLARFCLVVANRILSRQQGHWSPRDAGLDRLPATFASPAAVPLKPMEATSFTWNLGATDVLPRRSVLK